MLKDLLSNNKIGNDQSKEVGEQQETEAFKIQEDDNIMSYLQSQH